MTDASLLDYVLDALAPLGGVRARRMFGGHGVYRHEAFFAIVFRGRVYFRTDEATRPAYRAAGSAPFMPSRDQTLGTYWEVPAEVLDDPDELRAWARRAAARPLSPPKPMKKKRKSTPAAKRPPRKKR